MPDGVEQRALNLLRRMVGPTTEFRQHQLEAILALVRDRRRVLLVQRTGWGKSAVYFIATRLLRDDGAGPTLLVSPLLALMRNQIAMAERLGVRAASINSENRRDWEPILEELRRGEVDLLLISPERLNNPLFRREALPLVAAGTGLLVVDEIHCISDWGHDFRPDYRRLVRVLELLPRGIPVLGTTATANDRVVDDIHEQLGQDLLAIRGPLDRGSLSLAVLALPSQAERMAWLADHLPGLPGTGIVYCLTIGDAERLAEWLRSRGIPSVAYTGQSDAERRLEIERDLLENMVKVVVATSALGMGFDKPDLGFVVHFQAPGTPIAYYQQVGRAGRALADSVGLLLAGREDKDIQDYFISTAFPPREQAERVVAMLLEAGRSLSVADILAHVNVRRTRLDAMLKILEVEGAVERSDGGWRRTLKPWSYDQERVERVTVERRAEQAAMLEYQRTDGCLMEFLRRRLDDPGAVPCGRCMNCTGRRPDPTVDRGLADAARTFLRCRDIEVAPRLMWPPGLDALRGRIDPELTLRPGRSLSVYNDGGWGELVRAGKQHDGFFSDELVEASMQLIRRWRPDPPPTWVTCVPSTSRPDLVPSFAERLAAPLGLPFRAVIRKRQAAAPQKEMENSVQQLMNVRQAFEVEAGSVLEGPVLLLDDIVDSRWTLTVVGMELLRAGSGPVHPFVLAQAVST